MLPAPALPGTTLKAPASCAPAHDERCAPAEAPQAAKAATATTAREARLWLTAYGPAGAVRARPARRASGSSPRDCCRRRSRRAWRSRRRCRWRRARDRLLPELRLVVCEQGAPDRANRLRERVEAVLLGLLRGSEQGGRMNRSDSPGGGRDGGCVGAEDRRLRLRRLRLRQGLAQTRRSGLERCFGPDQLREVDGDADDLCATCSWLL